jgi:hypothetical protein
MEACLKRLSTRGDVHGVMVVTIDGDVLYECDALAVWVSGLSSLCAFARHLIRDDDPNDLVQALRLRTKTHEILITVRDEQLLIVMQMIAGKSTNEADADQEETEEDWQAFLKRIHQQQKDNNH